MKRLIFFIFAIVNGFSMYSQNASLSFNVTANLTPGFYFSDYSGYGRRDVSISSDPSMAYEGSASYSRPLSERVAIEMGLLGGVQSYSFTLFFEDSFIDYQSFQQDFFLEKISEYDLEYYGINLGVRYKLLERNKNSLGLSLGVNAVYFLHTDHYFSYGATLSNNQEKKFFYAHSNLNPKNTIFLAPNFGIWYNYHLNNQLALGLKLNGLVSNHVIIENSYQEPEFIIYGDNEIVKGSWQKQYRQFGVGLSFSYLLSNNETIANKR